MKTFIVVDDDPINNKLCVYSIRKIFANATIHCFESAAKSLQFLADNHESLADSGEVILYLDINMPEMSGWQFLENFGRMHEQLRGKISVFVVSSSIDPNDREKALAHPLVTGYLSKPLTIPMILDTIAGSVKASYAS